MNERIKQLLEQCQIETYGVNGELLEIGFDAEKFAQLIVRECAAICQDVDGEDNIDARSGRQDCAVEIREHFGVEE